MQDDGINVNIVHQLKAAAITNAVTAMRVKNPPRTPKKKGLQILSVTP